MRKKNPKFIAVTQLKGGVGKTAVTVNLAAGLAMRRPTPNSKKKNKVLVVDCDANHSGTTYFEIFKKGDPTFLDILMGKATIDEAIKTITFSPNPDDAYHFYKFSIDLIQSQDIPQNIAESLISFDDPKKLLKKAIMESTRINNYDYVLFDCPSGSDMLYTNIYNVCDYYIIPAFPDKAMWNQVPLTYEKIGVLSNLNKKHFLGCIINNYEKGYGNDTNIEILKNIKGIQLFDTVIPHYIEYKSMELACEPIQVFRNRNSAGHSLYRAYRNLTKEFLNKINAVE